MTNSCNGAHPVRLQQIRLQGLLLCGALGGVLLLGACASLPPPPESITPVEHVITGRLSVQYSDPNGQKEQLHGRFEWIERGPETEVTLTDPLGQAVARILSDALQTSITLRSGETYSGTTPEALTARTLGWALPLSGMRQWLRGQASADAEVERTATGRISLMRQNGWTIQYVNVADDPPGRPSRIDLAYAGPGPEVALRIALDAAVAAAASHSPAR